jgi:hypothetical protein
MRPDYRSKVTSRVQGRFLQSVAGIGIHLIPYFLLRGRPQAGAYRTLHLLLKYMEQIRKCIELRLKAMGALRDVNINVSPPVTMWDKLVDTTEVPDVHEDMIREAGQPLLEIRPPTTTSVNGHAHTEEEDPSDGE